MKRPFAVIGFSMLLSTLIFYNISFRLSVALTIGMMVIFCIFLCFKIFRKNKFILFSLASVVAFSLSFITAQYEYVNIENNMGESVEIRGIVCQTPTHSDYAHTYIIRLENENYKIRYISEDNRYFEQGTIVSGTLKKNANSYAEPDFLDSTLASGIYFTFFETEEFHLNSTGERNSFYSTLGTIKNSFINATYTYISGENAGIANAMTIGDRSGISSETTENFNYAGSSHLLVVSGLHLSFWALGIINILRKNSLLRNFSVIISLAVLLFYASLTGFSVSVIRAGVMVGAIIIARLFRRDADSLNSIGLGVTLIMLTNPFAAYSVALWFTAFSTVGILVIQKPLEKWIYSTTIGKKLSSFSIFRFLISSSTVSLSATICTLPIFIIKFEFLPWASIISNILMVDAALVVMATTVAGAFCHFLHITPLAQLFYFISGSLGSFLRLCAEKIGLAEWSGLPMTDVHYKEFLFVAVIGVIFAYFLRKRIPHIIKTTATCLAFVFVLLSLATTLHDYNTPTIEISNIDSQIVIHINYKGESVLIGCGDKSTKKQIKHLLNSHGQKSPELLIITDTNDYTFSQICDYQKTFYFSDVAFCGDKLSMFKNATDNISSISMGNDFKIDLSQYHKQIEFSHNGKNIVYICNETEENPFKNDKQYDIIISYSDLTCLSSDEYIKISQGETLNIEF